VHSRDPWQAQRATRLAGELRIMDWLVGRLERGEATNVLVSADRADHLGELQVRMAGKFECVNSVPAIAA